ncbi:30S ribosomal protein S4 [endosymbiont GvMRE of Glomus versiforme]|uniref:30S ribosomal protein S4 n=1 Tax=endosymbiont GvMRE of Glomus versiforme TaxID=2039283 RepID=UPI000EBDB789|nr:30S ribosomal protein S4 [endosymbiont GvMRE of Glomus versiforme]RHZ35407.1 30S ribosomal protein S4 [endosymbiont GvMRE of Glomus versiforme]
MSRYIGPFWKKSRSLSFSLLWNKKEFRKNITQKKKTRESLYKLQLKEKQKIKYGYGWRDRQMKNEYMKIKAKSRDTNINLLVISEMRLDSLVFRSGLVNTLNFARQLVSHKHILVDGKTVNIPSYKVEAGQVIILKEEMKQNELIKNSLEQNIKTPSYIAFDKKELTIAYLRRFTHEELEQGINTSLVTEWYNRRI